MASSATSKATDEQKEALPEDDPQHEVDDHVGWKVLFGFTTRKHLPVFCSGFVVAVVAAATLPAMGVLFGLIFRQFAAYGAGEISGSVLLHNASNYCIYLTAVCAACWFANSVYFTLFLALGELQARSAREIIFNALIRKDMEWYDTRENGIAASLPSLQT
jgi:ATP-binding cassette subfamily B (MDR/TAP) protein 1